MRNPAPIRILLTILLCLSLPAQALALSCARWDAGSVYRSAAEAEERYVVALGTFHRTGPDRVTGDNHGGRDPYAYTAQFSGQLASRAGFHTPANLAVDLRISCVSAWCGHPPADGQEALVFLQVDDNRDYTLQIGACPYWVMPDPDQNVLDEITQCMRGGC